MKHVVAKVILSAGCIASSAALAAAKTPSAPLPTKPATLTKPALEQPDHDVELRLAPRFAPAPGTVHSTIRVKPHPDNRVLRVVVDSDRYYRSSDIELDGAGAARTHFLVWDALPEGAYTITVTVYGIAGQRGQESAPFEVRGVGTTR